MKVQYVDLNRPWSFGGKYICNICSSGLFASTSESVDWHEQGFCAVRRETWGHTDRGPPCVPAQPGRLELHESSVCLLETEGPSCPEWPSEWSVNVHYFASGFQCNSSAMKLRYIRRGYCTLQLDSFRRLNMRNSSYKSNLLMCQHLK